MPACRDCRRVQSSAEVRRTRKGDHVCKEKFVCAARRERDREQQERQAA